MSYYEDLSQYQWKNDKLENVLNIGWLGEDRNFTKGIVSDEFLLNLWEYYKCPLFMYEKRGLYNNQGLDGYWKFFTAIYNERSTTLGKSEIRVLDENNNTVYVAPDLILHYIVNHGYLPPQEFVDAVINGPKPNSKEYSNMVANLYKNIKNHASEKDHCPFCYSKYVTYAYSEKRHYEMTDKLIVVDTTELPQEKDDEKNYIRYRMCKGCGKLSLLNYDD